MKQNKKIKFKDYNDSLISFIEYWQSIDFIIRKHRSSNIISELNSLVNSAARKSLLVARYIEKGIDYEEVFNDFDKSIKDLSNFYKLFAISKLKEIASENDLEDPPVSIFQNEKSVCFWHFFIIYNFLTNRLDFYNKISKLKPSRWSLKNINKLKKYTHMKNILAILFVSIFVFNIGTRAFAQEKVETESILVEAYKVLLVEVLDSIREGNFDSDVFMKSQADSLIRQCFLTDADVLMEYLKEQIEKGKIVRPSLKHKRPENGRVLKKSTIRVYNKSFAAFFKSLNKSVKTQTYEGFVLNNKKISKKIQMAIYKEFRYHRDQKLLNVKY